jgi:TusA-related sulfurtransferase
VDKYKRGIDLNKDYKINKEIDCVGYYCPMPIAMTKEAIDEIEIGQILKIEADDPASEEDIKRWAKRTGHDLLKFEKKGTILTFFIKKMK